ncbi:hypothetical protein C1H46_013869 [Malus baccata]|uniref:Uncharacterized protein n=1 Tax=Malus baccata TaxID=106549 RepID=A0A540MQK9_MALBA|nr:hypothetical protein C1H46_013869 [Malus baccata]
MIKMEPFVRRLGVKAVKFVIASIDDPQAQVSSSLRGILSSDGGLSSILISLCFRNLLWLFSALSKEENGLCVFYWNGSFDNIYKINNELFFLAASEDVVEWRHLDQVQSLLICQEYINNCLRDARTPTDTFAP